MANTYFGGFLFCQFAIDFQWQQPTPENLQNRCLPLKVNGKNLDSSIQGEKKKKKKSPDLAPGPDLSLHGQFKKKKLKKMASFASRARFGKNLPRSKNDVISQFAIALLWQN
jgi:hypothetical protein